MSFVENTPELGLQEFYPPVEPIFGRPEVYVGQNFRINGLAEAMRATPGSFFLKPELYQELGLDDGLLQGAYFEEVPEWKLGREDSKSNVFFGNLTLVPDLDGQAPLELPVACKPYLTWHNGAIHEYAAYQTVNEMGFIKTFEPIGFWTNQEGGVFLLSRFEEHVQSLDNISWVHDTTRPLKEHLTVFGALERVAYTLGRFHSRGFAHRDAQVKNMAVDLETSEMRAIDLEQLTLVQTPQQPNLPEMQSRMYKDAQDFVQSIYASGYLRGDSYEERKRVLRTAFIQPYVSTLRHPSTMITAKYGSAAGDMVERVARDLESSF